MKNNKNNMNNDQTVVNHKKQKILHKMSKYPKKEDVEPVKEFTLTDDFDTVITDLKTESDTHIKRAQDFKQMLFNITI